MWPWKIVVRYAFYSVLALYTLLEVTESRDGMFQEVGKVAEKVKERKLAKAKAKIEKEEEERMSRLADKQALLEEARRRVAAAQQKSKKKSKYVDLLVEDDEDMDPFLPLEQARSVLEKILKEAEEREEEEDVAVHEAKTAEAENAPAVASAPLPEDPEKQRVLLARLMASSLLEDEEVKQHLSTGRVLHCDLAAAANDWAQMLDDEDVERHMAQLREQMAEAAA